VKWTQGQRWFRPGAVWASPSVPFTGCGAGPAPLTLSVRLGSTFCEAAASMILQRYPRMGERLILSVLLLALGLAACEREQPREVPAAAPVGEGNHAATDPAMEQTAECINRMEGYAVEYPATWHVNPGEVLGPCMLFDPEPVEVPPASELPLEIAIQIGFEPVPFATLTGQVLGRRDLVRERTTVDGREALRIESETTGEGLHDRGIRMYQYFVDLGDTTMVAATHAVGALPFERKRRILDTMMARFDFREPG
jgi:hypothetical protein